MRKYLLFICLIFVSCSQTYLEETQNIVSISTRVSYDTLDTGIYLEWDTQWDFARIEISRGTKTDQLTVFKDKLAHNQWLDVENLPGQDYYYRVSAYNSKNRLIGESDIYKGLRSYRPYDQIVTPRSLDTDFAKYSDRIEIYWAGNAQDSFRIYRSESLDGVQTKIAEAGFNTIEELKFSDYNIQSGMSYFYKIASVGKEANGTVSEKMSTDSIEGSSKVAPKGVVTNTIVGGITVSWDEDIKAEYYQIYRSETEEGEFQLVAPFVKEEQYTDKTLPNMKGTDINGTYTYPSYYYKIKSFAKGNQSGFSDPVVGHAIDPKDLLPAPASFDVAVDKSSYSSELNSYNLTFSWDAVGDSGVTYLLSKINSGVTNVITTTSALTYSMPNEAFNSQWEYTVQAINNNAGDLPGAIASKNYTSATPAPPIIATITTNARTFITNIDTTHKNAHVYWNMGGETGNHVAGTVKKEWNVTSEVGNIDLTWNKQVDSELVDFYTIYRRKQGETDFTKIAENIVVLTHSDITLPDYQGSVIDGEFKYPLYEYQITATFGIDESGPSIIELGSAINKADILPAPAYLTIPGHWANGSAIGNGGFGTGSKWLEGENSPDGADQILNKGGNQHLYLTWGKVDRATTYRVRHSRGSAQENWYSNDEYYPAKNNNTSTVRWFDNQTTGDHKTGLFTAKDGIPWFGGYRYQKDNASFDVGSINGAAGNILGDVRGIWFEEPDANPY